MLGTGHSASRLLQERTLWGQDSARQVLTASGCTCAPVQSEAGLLEALALGGEERWALLLSLMSQVQGSAHVRPRAASYLKGAILVVCPVPGPGPRTPLHGSERGTFLTLTFR